uniref:Uncharacterized protein n=1 Tax=Arundo donax TaxID=35708 RepID=A0A0A9FXF9_ARUDO
MLVGITATVVYLSFCSIFPLTSFTG